ncbi:30S ribosomal protein S5 [Candidatus Giovannonibacteria bacterium RIFCSPLOWO2_02_FULL_43_11b]|uniref:Small ribosomal subunit protein uS5 n=1 Tax=Candidatus Giovannonibacteria bacterium RIFCSPHIGHO2_12_FULL_43_15 TaxID=1798341 RepID=A0A1F5WRD0_9BACT|nr:MAG: 30S ribosomal protein S5 [Candidatus Giovannonibacteria bacterium RIFCSPHIGHO2_01_FULL_43_100]OGF66956.1 MAG: 30S ribosomal protein S5 [Candidatus Giovannonibacteria bacterium RIFCSPHIGHO2_02_FULL_43_32]OGF78137.1 MAG: 30S ribosomal protein S5 [Candidatus Giovannonibacteria bacterium RIFCSPHIGHO2_12_FULL_43_15]OGF78544.1 MAG: 30S ribosomal protein S5 [Candidatus Giovannonibacteria bacterium RIFCSPLOWO2_01_FULL_43_60]OGF89875.1 MAG: 30S ribosomal protein S5 [Candidatus Giovannonibacteria
MARFNSNRREKSEFSEKMVDLRRVARVMAGGRRFTFRATLVIGDKRGRVGVGTGKGTHTALAMEKAIRSAKKRMIMVPLTKAGSIPFEIEAKYGAARVRVRPIATGRGLVAGGAVRSVLELAGVTDTSAKIISHTKNKISNARAAIEALKKLRHIEQKSEPESVDSKN